MPSSRATGQAPSPEAVITMLRGFVMTVEDLSRGSFADEAAHRFLAAINEQAAKVLAAFDRPDLLVRVLGAKRATDAIEPKEGWAHVGCPTCGMVTTVPIDRTEPPPWCLHNGTTYVWRDPHPDTQAGEHAWTRMVRVEVISAAS